MPKQFYTERDIEDMARRGELSIELSDDVVLTDLAYERANRLGVKLIKSNLASPSAPVRPYISKDLNARPAAPAGTQQQPAPAASPARPEDLKQRIRAAVIARLGSQVDSTLLDVIIARVLTDVGAK